MFIQKKKKTKKTKQKKKFILKIAKVETTQMSINREMDE